MKSLTRWGHDSTYWDRRFADRPDLSGAGHAGLSVSLNEAMYEAKRDVLLSFLKEYEVPIEGARVLDAGCGTGFFSELFVGQGASVTGIDFSENSLAICKGRVPQARFLLKDLVTDELESLGSFNLICAFDVLIHIVDDEQFIAALHKLLERGDARACFMCTDLFVEPPRTAEYTRNRPIRYYSDVLTANGYEILELRPVRYILAKWPTIDKIASALPSPFRVTEKVLLRAGVRQNLGNLRMLFARRPHA